MTLLAQGGGAGGVGTISAGGAGGSAATSSGAQTFAGGNGGAGLTSTPPSERGGGGGSAFANAAGGAGTAGARNDPGDGGIGEGNGGNGGIGSSPEGGTTAGSGFAPGGGGGGCSGAGAGAGAPGKIIVTYDIPALEGTTGSPPNLASNWTLEPGATLTVTFQVTLNENTVVKEVTNTASVTSDEHPEPPLSDSVTDPVNQPPTAVVLGDIELVETRVSVFLRGLGVDGLDSAGLLAYLGAWDPVAAERLAGADRAALLAALRGYLDPDADGEVVLFRWETLEERGTVGFYVERRASGSNWMRINANLLPAMVAAPMGAEYVLADPGALADIAYDYRLIELEARGTTREYGPFRLQARD